MNLQFAAKILALHLLPLDVLEYMELLRANSLANVASDWQWRQARRSYQTRRLDDCAFCVQEKTESSINIRSTDFKANAKWWGSFCQDH